MPALTQAQLGCDNVAWFAHATERLNHWQLMDARQPGQHDAIIAQWQRERMLTWTRLTPRERRLIMKHR
jgi:hypothetical protein